MADDVFSCVDRDDFIGLRKAVEAAGPGSSLVESRREGLTPLMVAAAKGHAATVATLLELGADARRESPRGQTAARIAELNGHLDLAAKLRVAAQAQALSAARPQGSFDDDELLRSLLGSTLFDAARKLGLNAAEGPGSEGPSVSAPRAPASLGPAPAGGGAARPAADPRTAAQGDGQAPQPRPEPEIRLDDLVGQSAAKNALRQIIATAKINEERKARGMKAVGVNLHSVFSGSPGTGKTTFARFFAQEIRKLGVLKKGHLVEVSRADVVAEFMGQTASKTVAVCEKARGGVLFIDEAYSLKQGKDDAYGQEAIDALLKFVEDARDQMILILAGYSDEMRAFLDLNPGLRSRVPNQIEFADFSDAELAQVFDQLCGKSGFVADARGRAAALSEVARKRKGRYFGNAREVRNAFERAVAQQALRLSTRDLKALTPSELTLLNYEDFTQDPEDGLVGAPSAERTDSAEVSKAASPPGAASTPEAAPPPETAKGRVSAMARLEALVGLAPVKDEIRKLSDLIRVTRARTGRASLQNVSLHMAFLGSPGTGKSTVARLLGEIMRELEILPSGHLVEADRSRLVGAHLGETSIKTRERVEAALGGVLFVDEAYALARGGALGGADSYGQEAIDALMKAMEDRRDQFVCVVSGPTREMSAFLDSNPGLRSRFARALEFPDYDDDQLAAVAEGFARESGFALASGSLNAIRLRLSEERARGGSFGNARSARRLVEAAFRAQASRLVKLGDPETLPVDALKTLEPEDFA